MYNFPVYVQITEFSFTYYKLCSALAAKKLAVS